MNARKPAKPRKARKPKLIEIDGHQLTPELYREYERCRESRQHTNRGASQAHIERLALEDTVNKHRFSRSAKEKLSAIYLQLTAVASAAMALGHYPFYESDPRHVQLAGCDALNRLAAEAQLLGAKIHAIGEAIRYEDREHLQDWLKRQAALDAASPYGLAPTVQP
ncbi:MAG: hypothetical protein WBW93_17865 [Steroidobacteraceae bacterium]